MVNSPYYLHNSTMYPQTVEMLYRSKALTESKIASLASSFASSGGGSKSELVPGTGPTTLEIPDPGTSTCMHMRAIV